VKRWPSGSMGVGVGPIDKAGHASTSRSELTWELREQPRVILQEACERVFKFLLKTIGD
jgi:hypothetical protein